MNSLPKDLQKIINEYKDEEKYKGILKIKILKLEKNYYLMN